MSRHCIMDMIYQSWNIDHPTLIRQFRLCDYIRCKRESRSMQITSVDTYEIHRTLQSKDAFFFPREDGGIYVKC